MRQMRVVTDSLKKISEILNFALEKLFVRDVTSALPRGQGRQELNKLTPFSRNLTRRKARNQAGGPK